jgi:hypothetical protein
MFIAVSLKRFRHANLNLYRGFQKLPVFGLADVSDGLVVIAVGLVIGSASPRLP